MTKLSALVVAHNEEAQLADCLERLRLADELVVVLDKCSDGSKAIAERFGAVLVEGAWEIEGPRRNAGIAACSGDWILEVDADERVPATLFEEIRTAVAGKTQGIYYVPFNNFVGRRLVRYGWGASIGKAWAPCVFARGCKVWGNQRLHPSLDLTGPREKLTTPIDHYVDRDVADLIQRLNAYSSARALDLRDTGQIGGLANNIRRFFSRFIKCYVGRKGYREGALGFVIALCAGLYPLLSHLKARVEQES
jgi:glycosyltransferase involved in cell wall biosynthesis